jgi:hypothetical protein
MTLDGIKKSTNKKDTDEDDHCSDTRNKPYRNGPGSNCEEKIKTNIEINNQCLITQTNKTDGPKETCEDIVTTLDGMKIYINKNDTNEDDHCTDTRNKPYRNGPGSNCEEKIKTNIIISHTKKNGCFERNIDTSLTIPIRENCFDILNNNENRIIFSEKEYEPCDNLSMKLKNGPFESCGDEIVQIKTKKNTKIRPNHIISRGYSRMIYNKRENTENSMEDRNRIVKRYVNRYKARNKKMESSKVMKQESEY